MPQKFSDERIVFRLSSDDDTIELDKLGEGFTALAREFQDHLASAGIEPSTAPAKLIVTNLKKSSIEFEIGTVVTLYGWAYSGVDFVVTWTEFYEKIKRGLSFLAGKEERPANFDQSDARNLDSFLNTVRGKKNPKVSIKRARLEQKNGDRSVIAEFEFTEQDMANADITLAQELGRVELEAPKPQPSYQPESGVPFIWHRTDREKGKHSGQTSDRGVIAKISDKPLPVFFASEVDNYKDYMVKQEHNPFNLVYLIDVLIAYNDDREPQSYTITNIAAILGPDGKPV